MITAAQCRMARAALDWNVLDLAREAKVGPGTIVRFEANRGRSNAATVMAIERAFEAAGIRFTERGVELPPAAEAKAS